MITESKSGTTLVPLEKKRHTDRINWFYQTFLRTLQLLDIETPESLLIAGRIESLACQGREPICVRQNTNDAENKGGWYQVIPRGYRLEQGMFDSERHCYVFGGTHGNPRVGNLFYLTDTEVKLVKQRIEATKKVQ